MKKVVQVLMLTAAVFSLTFAALGQETPVGEWKISGYTFKDKMAYPIDQMKVTLNINADNKRVGGSGGCNVYGGDLELKDGSATSGLMFSTMMACEDIVNKFERLFLNTLETAEKYSFEDGKLKISSSDGFSSLVFVRNTPPETITLFVNKKIVPCSNGPLTQCLQVKSFENDEWYDLQREISGFDHREGTYYKIEVERTRDAHQQGEVPSFSYKLKNILLETRSQKKLFQPN